MVSFPETKTVIVDFMEQHGLPYDEILTSCDKPIATAYIDDRGVAYQGDWLQAVRDVIKLTEMS